MNSGPSSPLVSVLVTVYNREKYLAECLTSILNSTFEDYEIVIVDDCSADRSMQIAEQFAQQDARIRVFKNDQNLGDYPNRNCAAKHARGSYLKYLDADDLIYKYSLALMVDAVKQFPDAALALSANGSDYQSPYPQCFSPTELYKAHFLHRSPLGAGPSAAIIRRRCFESVAGFSGKQFVGDSELWLKLAERWPVVTIQPALIWWRQHDGQQIKEEQNQSAVLDMRYKLELDFINATSHLSAADKESGMRRLNQNHARRILALAFRQRKLRDAWMLFCKSGISIRGMFEGFRRYSQ